MFMYINEDKNIHKIYLSDINYIESYREYIKINTGKKSYLTKTAISKIEVKLKNNGFERIHKSYIISTNKISSFNSRFVTVVGKQLPIGRTYKHSLMETLKYAGDLL